jgi:hypothetical protein
MTLQEMKDAIAKLQEQIAKMEEPKTKTVKRWRAEICRSYWYVANNGEIYSAEDNKSNWDNFLYSTGCYFQTKEEAEAYRDKLIRIQAIKDRIAELNGWSQPKFKGDNPNYALCIHNDGSLFIADFYLFQYLPRWAYFKSKEIGEQLMKEFGNDLFLLFE